MVDVIWSDSAKEDLKDIKQYISKTSKEYAELFVDRIFEVIENLEIFLS
jgi:plasmid stabilization system protein ParE